MWWPKNERLGTSFTVMANCCKFAILGGTLMVLIAGLFNLGDANVSLCFSPCGGTYTFTV